MQQLFIDQEAKLNQEISLNEEQQHHLKNVLRMKQEDIIRVVDSASKRYYAKLVEQRGTFAIVCFEAIEASMERNYEVTLLVGLIKKEKWDWVLQKSTELGVSKIVPFESMRTVVKSKEEKVNKKQERYQKIVLEAANQCKRDRVPEITLPIKLKDAAKYKSEINLVAYERVDSTSLNIKEAIKEFGNVTVIIGPEGGFDESEIAMLVDEGYRCVNLGKRILRAETAVVYALSALDAIME